MVKPEEILKSAREAKGYTQASLAKAVNVSSRMLQRYEEGKFPKYKSEVIESIDQLLGTDLIELIYDKKRLVVPDKKDDKAFNNKEEIFLHGSIKMTAQEYVDSLKSDKQQLQEVITTSLAAIQLMLNSLRRHDQAYHETILRSLARLEKKKPEDALILEAHTRDVALLLEEKGTDIAKGGS